MVAVGGRDIRVTVQAQQADGQAAQRCHDTGRVPGPDQGLIFLVSDVADQWSLFSISQWPRTQAARVSGPASRSLVMR